jgi:hypothetical protein
VYANIKFKKEEMKKEELKIEELRLSSSFLARKKRK